MSNTSSNSSASDPESEAPRPEAVFQDASSKGDEYEYVMALQHLGLFMAKRLLKRIAEVAIADLAVEPTSPLLVGDVKCKTKERDLKPNCNK